MTKKPTTAVTATTEKEDYFCVQQTNNKDEFKCKGEILDANSKRIGNSGDDDAMLHHVIESSQNWKLQFDRNTRGIDVVVTFAKVSVISFAFIENSPNKILLPIYVTSAPLLRHP